MIFSECVDLVLLNVLGGKLTEDAPVLRPEVEAYMPTLLAAAMEEWYNMEIEKFRRLGKNFSLPRNAYSVYTFDGPFLKDANGDWYIDLPGKVHSVNGAPMIQSVTTSQGAEYVYMSGGNLFPLVPSYFTVMANDTSWFTRIILSDKPPCKMIVYAMLMADCMNNWTIPIVDAPLYLAIDKATDHFRKQAGSPMEVNIDNTGVNDVNKPKDA